MRTIDRGPERERARTLAGVDGRAGQQMTTTFQTERHDEPHPDALAPLPGVTP